MILTSFLNRVLGDNLMCELIFIVQKYHLSFTEKRPTPMIISAMDGDHFTNGFADRLRGMLTAYAFAKANHLPFRIIHNNPFRLETFYAPNQIDWRYKEDEGSKNILYSNPIVLLDHTKGTRLKWLPKRRQYWFYSNIDAIELINLRYNTDYSYHSLFSDLFQPSSALLQAASPYANYIQEGYISISFRFMQLMGDLKDVRGKTLSECEQDALKKKCISFIEQMHLLYPEYQHILVTSDSSNFMASVAELPYVFTIPGEIGHIGHMSSEAIHLKTFLDFYMISQAQKAFMGYTGEMYKSNFAKSAAATTGIPYESIQF